jgi:hypothetical protein
LVAVEIILIFAGEVTLFGSIYILSKSISINKTFLLVKPLFLAGKNHWKTQHIHYFAMFVSTFESGKPPAGRDLTTPSAFEQHRCLL